MWLSFDLHDDVGVTMVDVVSAENRPRQMEWAEMKTCRGAVGPSHLFKTYWDVLTGKRDLNNQTNYKQQRIPLKKSKLRPHPLHIKTKMNSIIVLFAVIIPTKETFWCDSLELSPPSYISLFVESMPPKGNSALSFWMNRERYRIEVATSRSEFK